MTELHDDLLEKAFGEARERMLARLPDDAKLDHVFSGEFEERMRRMIRAEKRSPWQRRMTAFARRAAVIVVAAVVGFSACVPSVDAWKQGLFKMVEEKFPEYSSITYEPVDGAAGVAEFTLAEYQPAYLPDGFRLTEQMLADSINWSTYTNAEGDMISFQQSILGSGTMAINTEGSQLEEFDLGGETAYKMDNRGSQFVLWNDNQYSYMVLTNDMTLDEAVRIAASIRLYPPDAPHPPHLPVDQGLLPDPYTPEEAAENGDVVISGGGIENVQALEALLNAQQASPAQWTQLIIRVTDFDRGGPIIRDLYFDGFRVHCDEDNTRTEGQEKNTYSGYTYAKLVRETQDGVTVVYGIDDYTGDRVELIRYDETK